MCRRFAPAIYQLDDEGYLDLHLLEVPPELEAAAVLGAQACPAQAISVLLDEDRLQGVASAGAGRSA
jgi:ferredoxin